MRRIAHKFLNEAEKSFAESYPDAKYFELLHLFWTAKESLYKAYGLKELDFRKNIFVENIQWNGFNGQGVGRVEKKDFRLKFQLFFSKIEVSEGNALIWAVCLGE
jgi:phosphopantetheinyl transferase (holo-ACP synthase)